jgi:hypothetical protein
VRCLQDVRQSGGPTPVIMKALKTIAAIALFAAAASASAQHRHPGYLYPGDTGLYLSADVGSSSQSGPSPAATKARAAGLTLGYNINRQWALETTILDLGQRAETVPGFGLLNWTSQAASVSAVARVELPHNLDLSAKLGVASTTIDIAGLGTTGTVSGTGWVLGLGADYRLNRHWSVKSNIDTYADFAGSTDPMTVVTVGLKYRF